MVISLSPCRVCVVLLIQPGEWCGYLTVTMPRVCCVVGPTERLVSLSHCLSPCHVCVVHQVLQLKMARRIASLSQQALNHLTFDTASEYDTDDIEATVRASRLQLSDSLGPDEAAQLMAATRPRLPLDSSDGDVFDGVDSRPARKRVLKKKRRNTSGRESIDWDRTPTQEMVAVLGAEGEEEGEEEGERRTSVKTAAGGDEGHNGTDSVESGVVMESEDTASLLVPESDTASSSVVGSGDFTPAATQADCAGATPPPDGLAVTQADCTPPPDGPAVTQADGTDATPPPDGPAVTQADGTDATPPPDGPAVTQADGTDATPPPDGPAVTQADGTDATPPPDGPAVTQADGTDATPPPDRQAVTQADCTPPPDRPVVTQADTTDATPPLDALIET